MIGRLTGRIVEDDADGSIVLDVGGVGYEVIVPLGTVGRAVPDAASAVTLFVHTHVREDALQLYGFVRREERVAFRYLIGVSNIGPKIALSILGALTVEDLQAAIARNETAKLTKVPGVGKKTAERIVLELKDKSLASTAIATTPRNAVPLATPQIELLQSALTRMGFRPSEAERAIAALGSRVESAPLNELVREALALLSR